MPEAAATLRQTLRTATRSAHARVDGVLAGGIADLPDYARYLRGMHAFVASAESALRDGAAPDAWDVPAWLDWLRADLDALGLAPLAPEAMRIDGPAQSLGVLYVLEGSALGARVLLRDAQSLGLPAVRFLRSHADGESGERWPRFLIFLQQAASPDAAFRQTMLDAANAAFAVAERCLIRAREAHPH